MNDSLLRQFIKIKGMLNTIWIGNIKKKYIYIIY